MFTATAIRPRQDRSAWARGWARSAVKRLAPAGVLAALLLAAPAGAQPGDTAAEAPLGALQEQNILFVANCVGALWPDGVPIAAAGDGLPDGAMRFLDAHFFLDAQRRHHPDLAADIDAQIAATPIWLARTAEEDPVTAAEFQRECAIFLQDWLPASSPRR